MPELRGFNSEVHAAVDIHAQQIARDFGSALLHPEHIVLGVLMARPDVAAPLADRIGISLNDLVKDIKKRLFLDARGSEKRIPRQAVGDRLLSDRTKVLLEKAVDYARDLGDDGIGILHILSADAVTQDGLW